MRIAYSRSWHSILDSRVNANLLLVPDDTGCVATDSDPSDRLPNKTSSCISLQNSDILAVLVGNSDETTSLVHAELTRKAAARWPELVPHQTAIILQLEGRERVGLQDRAIWLREVERGVVTVGDDDETIVGLGNSLVLLRLNL